MQQEKKDRRDIKVIHKTNSYETSIKSTISFFRSLWEKWKIWNNIDFEFFDNVLILSIRSWEQVLKKYEFNSWNQKTVPQIYKIEWKEKIIQDVLDLWVIEQTLLFLADVFERWVKKDTKTKDIINWIFLWDKEQLKNFYNFFHNTDPSQYDWTANSLINSVLSDIELQKIS